MSNRGTDNGPKHGDGSPDDPAFQRTYQAARGFFELNMFTEAWEELEELNPQFRHLPSILLLRILILNNLEKWEWASIIGEGAIRHYPDFDAFYLAAAHAVRNFRGPAKAKSILLEGEHLLDEEAIFHAMLAGLECQLGNIEDAKAELQIAFDIDRDCRLKALDDPHLAPLWDSLGGAE